MLTVAALLVVSASASAIVHPAGVLQGAANDILSVDGVAMAPDGTGGLLYSRHVGGVTHLFAIPFAQGRWGSSVEVDGEDAYGASQPAIAAGEGGRLLVVWVQPRNVNSKGLTLYELASASMQPGADSFGRTIVVDSEVGEPYTGDVSAVEPKLAMAPDGVAYVVYRVATDDCTGEDAGNSRQAECPAREGELVDVRVARFDYLLWNSLGVINRAPQVAMRKPTPANAPSIGIGVEGAGVVAWQEPDVSGVARIWVRRLFGTVRGNVLQASPETVGGRPVSSDADAPDVAVSRYGEARVAYRIEGGQGSAVPVSQLYVASLPSSFDPHGGTLEAAKPIPAAVAADLGPPSGALDPSGDYRLAWSQGGGVRQMASAPRALATPASIGSDTGTVQTEINPAGGGASVWSASVGSSPAVQAREDYSDGAYQEARLAGNVAGPITGLSLAGSGMGDALVAWMQGPPGDAEVVGDFVQAPPAPFVISAPGGWERARRIRLSWEPTADAVGGVTYSIVVDGRVHERGLTAMQATLDLSSLGDGVHQLQVLASDPAGQRTMSAKTPLKIDANPPIVRLALIDGGRGVRVTVRDRGSGVEDAATRIQFGDGGRVNGRARARHRYARPGLYTITVHVRDRVGNQATVELRVRVA